MRKGIMAVLVVLVSLCVAATAFGEGASKEECVAKCKAAAEMLKKDKDAGLAEIGKKDGKFVWKDSYVFAMDLNGKMLAHPFKPELTEKPSLLAVTDKNKENPKKIFEAFVNVAKSEKGEGWVDYMWPKPGEEAPSQKDTYIYRVPETHMLVGAGIYK